MRIGIVAAVTVGDMVAHSLHVIAIFVHPCVADGVEPIGMLLIK